MTPRRPRVVLRNASSGDAVDVWEGDAREGVTVRLYPLHGGANQRWILCEGGRVASDLGGRGLCMAAAAAPGRRPSDGLAPVVLSSESRHTFTLHRDRFVLCELADGRRALAQHGDALVLKPFDEQDASQSWCILPVEAAPETPARPATSCHLRHLGLTEEELAAADSWELSCSVSVAASHDCTFFCVVGWAPGGYAGIQQVDGGRRVAIFSMWDEDGEDGDRVQQVEKGRDVTISKFGGEGEGLKSMKNFEWRIGEPVACKVTGRRAHGDVWHCSCHISSESGGEHLMATFARRASKQAVLRSSGFYSFVEDWDRSPGATGHRHVRRATFFDAKVRTAACGLRRLTAAKFTKVEGGCDAFAKDRATSGSCNKTGGFFLRTGGST